MTQAAVASCTARQQLVESMKIAVERIVALHRSHLGALVSGDAEAKERFQHDLQNALAYEQALVERYNSHVQGHDCQPKIIA